MKYTSLVLYHRDDDGFGSAFALWSFQSKTERESTKYVSVDYNEPLPDIPTSIKNIFIFDFSYDKSTCDLLNSKYSLILIDHHQESIKQFADRPYAVVNGISSGCTLTWQWCCDKYNTQISCPEILLYVEDRDLWKFKLLNSKIINLGISSIGWDFEAWSKLSIQDAFDKGDVLNSETHSQISTILTRLHIIEYPCNPDVFKIGTVNNSVYVSETCHEMLQNTPTIDIGMCWFTYVHNNELRCKISLRSRKTENIDVSKIAKLFCGNGHINAAGFTCSISDLIYMITNSGVRV